MKTLTNTLILSIALLLASMTLVSAGPIERACLKADRRAASRTLCSCIEDAAKPMFSRSQLRRIAKFFDDPHLSQVLRQSNRSGDEQLWDKYKAWGVAARSQCG